MYIYCKYYRLEHTAMADSKNVTTLQLVGVLKDVGCWLGGGGIGSIPLLVNSQPSCPVRRLQPHWTVRTSQTTGLLTATVPLCEERRGEERSMVISTINILIIKPWRHLDLQTREQRGGGGERRGDDILMISSSSSLSHKSTGNISLCLYFSLQEE